MSPSVDAAVGAWLEALEQRHLASMTFAELRRALQALSGWYVERRRELKPGTALDSAGKRAAFALFYAPLHCMTVGRIVRETGAHRPPPSRIVDMPSIHPGISSPPRSENRMGIPR